MTLYLIFVYFHILAVIGWIGCALFWFLMVPPLTTEMDKQEGRDLIQKIENSSWPPTAITSPLRLPLLKLGWIILAFVVLTGTVLLFLRGFSVQEITSGRILKDGLGLLGMAKIFLVGTIVVIEVFSNTRRVGQVRIVFLVSLLIVGISVLLVR